MAKPLINGEAYSWSRIVNNAMGRAVVGIDKISYKEVEDKQNNYGAGQHPVSRSAGQITPEGSVSLHMVELEALVALSPTGRLQDIPPFDWVVSFQPKQGKLVNHTLHNVEFLENSRDLEKGSGLISQDIPFIISHISWR